MNLTGRPVYIKGGRRKRVVKNDDDYFLAWLKTQPSALSGKFPCDPCHYRTAKNSGIGCKPKLSAIPLTRDEHLEQHHIGQYNFQPREWWEQQCEKYLRLWRSST